MGGSALAGRVPWLPNQQADKNGLATPVAMLFVERDQPIAEELAVGELLFVVTFVFRLLLDDQ